MSAEATTANRWPRSPRRIVLAILGVLCVGLAFAGVIVPGLPTTIFLILASYLFTRSCPWLEERLVRSRWFKPYLPFVDGRASIPERARWAAIGAMWAAVSASVAVTLVAGRAHPLFAAALVVAACVGTWFILRFRRTRSTSRT